MTNSPAYKFTYLISVMNILLEQLSNQLVPVVIFTDLERDDIGCINGLEKSFGLKRNNRLYIQVCYNKPGICDIYNDEVRIKKEEAFKKICCLNIDDIHKEDEKFDETKICDFLSRFNTNPLFVVISPLFGINLKHIISKLKEEYRSIILVTYTGRYNIRHNAKQFVLLYNEGYISKLYDFNKYFLFDEKSCAAKLHDWYSLTPDLRVWEEKLSKEKLETLLSLHKSFNRRLLHPNRLFGNSSITSTYRSHLKELYEKNIDEYCEYILGVDELLEKTGQKKNIVLSRHMAASLADDLIPLSLSGVLNIEVTTGVWKVSEDDDLHKISYVQPCQNGGNAYSILAIPPYDIDSIRDTLWEYMK